MAISIAWITSIITVPKDYTTQIQASPEIRTLDLNEFRGDVMALAASEEGAPYSTPFDHNAEQVISGDTFARSVVFREPYTVEFEDGQYAVKCIGANHNIADVKVANQVSLIIGNSGGLINLAAYRGIIS
jgi:hypothetical protein